MVGRGTRLCPDLFGPGKHKQFFYLFDYCQNLEYFSQNPETTEGALGASLGKRLFTARLELLSELDRLLIAGAGSGTASQEEHSTMRGKRLLRDLCWVSRWLRIRSNFSI